MDEKSQMPKINFCCCDGEREKKGVLFDYIILLKVFITNKDGFIQLSDEQNLL